MAEKNSEKHGKTNGEKNSGYRLLDHTADLRIEVFGRGREGLFTSAGEALTDLLVGIDKVGRGGCYQGEVVQYEVVATGDTLEELLVDWLRELLYIFSVKGKVFSIFEIVELTKSRIRAFCSGETFDIKRHGIKTEIKAVTYHGLEIKIDGVDTDVGREYGGENYTAAIIFDI